MGGVRGMSGVGGVSCVIDESGVALCERPKVHL